MLCLRNISKSYKIKDAASTKALQDVSLNIEDGESVAIMGTSGCGKSTLLQILGCITKPDSGEYYVDDKQIAKLSENMIAALRNKKFGFVMQNFGLIEYRSVLDNVRIPLTFSNKLSEKTRNQMCMEALQMVGLSGLENKKSGLLSGGEKQRVAIARAIVNSPDVILADEPTGALDSKNRDSIMRLFGEINKGGTTLIMVTHDESLAHYFRRIIHLSDGRVID